MLSFGADEEEDAPTELKKKPIYRTDCKTNSIFSHHLFKYYVVIDHAPTGVPDFALQKASESAKMPGDGPTSGEKSKVIPYATLSC